MPNVSPIQNVQLKKKKKVYNSVVYTVITKVCSHHHNQFENVLITPEAILPHLLAVTLHFPSVFPSSRQPLLIYFLSLQRHCIYYWTLHINGLIKYVVFCALLLSSNDALKVHPHCISISFLFIAE